MPNLGGIVAAVSQRRKRWNAASGGTEATVANYNGTGQTWKIHTFTSDGTFTVTSAANIFRVLLVAGGGGHGADGSSAHEQSGMGGAGGMLEYDSRTLTIGAKAVVRGAYGAAGANGSNSTFDGLTAVGGGRGGNGRGTTGASGGSGGGGGDFDGPGGAGTAGQGYAGGVGQRNSPEAQYDGGGGGGAGGAASGYTRGPGKANTITGSSVTYAAGGMTNQGAGTDYLGNGGGGGGPTANRGGHGVVIIAYRIG